VGACGSVERFCELQPRQERLAESGAPEERVLELRLSDSNHESFREGQSKSQASEVAPKRSRRT